MTTEKEYPTTIYQAEPIHRVLQGEGPNIGKKMLLLRLQNCDVRCESCDSFHTWRAGSLSPERQRRSIVDVANELEAEAKATGIYHILISGGEPHLQIPSILILMQELKGRELINFEDDAEPQPSFTYDIETTGARDWHELYKFFSVIQFNLSPKIGALVAGAPPEDYKFFSETMVMHAPVEVGAFNPIRYSLKVVVRQDQAEQDLAAVREFCAKYNIPKDKTYLMPFGVHRDQIIKESDFWIDYCLANGYQFSPRMHVLIYDNRRLV